MTKDGFQGDKGEWKRHIMMQEIETKGEEGEKQTQQLPHE